MTTLYDLHIAIRRAQRGAHPVRLRLERREPYPPHPARHGNELVLSDRAETVGRAEGELPGNLLQLVRLPAELLDLAVLGNRQRRQLPSASWMRESLLSPMASIAQTLFQGPGATLLETMHNALAGSAERYPWDMPAAVGRISLELADASLWAVPWEMLLPGPAWDDQVWRSCVIVRRDSEQAGTHTAPLTLPFVISIYRAAAELRDQQGWGDGLLAGSVGGYAQTARDMRALQWAETTGLPSSGAVHHIVFSSDDGAGEISAVAVLDRDGRPVPIGGRRTPSGVERLAAELQQYAATLDGRRPPRLLVLHDIAGQGTTGFRGGLDSELVRRGLEAGADAVWVVHCGTSDPAFADLFPMFYRKVLHNWPLDQALLAALAWARSRGREPLGWAFGARSGGELSVLLSEAVVAPTRSAVVSKEVLKGELPDVLGRRRGLRQPPRAAPVRRSERAAAELQARLQDATRAQVDVLETQAVRVSTQKFREEEHSLAKVLEAQEEVRAAVAAARAGNEARDQLAALPAGAVEAGTVRLTQLTLSAGTDGQGPKVTPDEALVTQRPYTLHVQIAPQLAEAVVAEAFPEAALTRVFERRPKVTLDVMVFSPASDFQIPRPRGSIDLPRYGPSSEWQTVITPQEAGQRRLRVCLYYQNTMLQSLWMEASVVRPGERAEGVRISASVDYVASADLALLDELPRPAVNLFTNETPQGDHWLGVFGQGDLSGFRLRSGDMYTLGTFPALSKTLRDKLHEVEGDVAYSYATGVELDAQGHLRLDEYARRDRRQNLCDLAKLGHDLFVAMFVGGSSGADRLAALGSQLQMPALVSVARCRKDSTTFPWPALYGPDIDPDASLSLCPEFESQLAANRWSAGLDRLLHKADLLDDPKRCHEQPACPLRGAAQETTVCPFGFWGFIHQVEQPLQQVTPTSAGQVPPELATGASPNQTSLLPHVAGTPVSVALGVYQDDKLETDAHMQELEGLQQERKVSLKPGGADRANREQLIATMKKGGQEVYYFYCHGELESGAIFKLKVGTGDSEGYIGPANLVGTQGSKVPQWQQDTPLVVLNGCDTVAVLPERVHTLMDALRLAGASGVVGTEIEVFPGLARPFGLQVLRALLDGASLGEAFLAARLHLLRQYNPLGLAYSFYAPATLHLHDATDCAWCKAHPPTRVGSGPGG